MKMWQIIVQNILFELQGYSFFLKWDNHGHSELRNYGENLTAIPHEKIVHEFYH